MSTPFGRTLRSLQADRSRHPGAGLLLLGLLGGWGAWLGMAEVPVCEFTASAGCGRP
ncbi:MAG: hypothetical protein JO112_07160 [Planctomycetes bacterium]|nr:hypothetical protein [Planctomycetota bacterium]